MTRRTNWLVGVACAAGIVVGGCSQSSMSGDKMTGDKMMEKKGDAMMEKKDGATMEKK
jgi:hypothetical protein